MSVDLQDLVYFGTSWQLLQKTADLPAITLGGGFANAKVDRADGNFYDGVVEKLDAQGHVTDVVIAFGGATGPGDLLQGESLQYTGTSSGADRAAALFESVWNDPRYAGATIHVTGHSLGASYTEYVAAEAISTHGAAAVDARADFTAFGVPNISEAVAQHFGLAANILDGRFTGYSAANDPTINGGTVHGTSIHLPAFWGLTGANAAFDLVAAHWPTTYSSALGLPDWLSADQKSAIVAAMSDKFPTHDSYDPNYGSPGSTPLSIRGAAGDDHLSGMGGNDTIVGGTGTDVLTGGGGADVFRFEAIGDTGTTPATADRITDWTSGDRIDLTLIDADTTRPLQQGFTYIGDQAFTGAGQLRSWAVGDTTWVAGNVDANPGADFLIRIDGSHHLSAQDFLLTPAGLVGGLLNQVGTQLPLVGSLLG